MNNNKNNFILPDKKKLPYGGAEAVVCDSLADHMTQLVKYCIDDNCLQNVNIQNLFCETYRHWILSTKQNQVVGLDKFPIMAYSNGTSESFDKFYLKHHSRRFRCFRGEYMYHMASWKTYCPNWLYIDDAPLEKNDAVVISFPFADIGQEHSGLSCMLDRCLELGIPVLLDCAYFGLCGDMRFDLTHDAITDVTFSLSKFMPVAHLRIGVRFTKIDDDDSLLVLNKTLYTNRLGASLGIKIMQHYDPDWIYNKYRQAQIELCDQLQVIPSKSVIFGIDFDGRYPEYNRGGHSNRLSLAKRLHQQSLPGDKFS